MQTPYNFLALATQIRLDKINNGPKHSILIATVKIENDSMQLNHMNDVLSVTSAGFLKVYISCYFSLHVCNTPCTNTYKMIMQIKNQFFYTPCVYVYAW